MYEKFTLFARKITHWILEAGTATAWSLDHRTAPTEYFPANNFSKTGFSKRRKGGIMTGFYFGMRAVSYIDN
jgi:hypothetical protein